MSVTSSLVVLTLASFRIFNPYNGDEEGYSSLESLTCSTRAGTSIWRKPPLAGSTVEPIDNLSAPAFVASINITQFRRARVTINPDLQREFDQGGLIFLLPAPEKQGGSGGKRPWVKAGLELYQGEIQLATVATGPNSWSDWSLSPVPESGAPVTVEMVREEVNSETGSGSSLCVYVIYGAKRKLIRDVTWAFGDERGMVDVGIYAARPVKLNDKRYNGTEDMLSVNFSNLIVERLSENQDSSTTTPVNGVDVTAKSRFLMGISLIYQWPFGFVPVLWEYFELWLIKKKARSYKACSHAKSNLSSVPSCHVLRRESRQVEPQNARAV